MRVLILTFSIAMLASCASPTDPSAQFALLQRVGTIPDISRTSSPADEEFAGVVVTTDTQMVRGAIETCVVIRDAAGATSPPTCFPGGRDGGRARLVSGFPWLSPGDQVRLQARHIAVSWQVVQHSVHWDTPHAVSVQDPRRATR